MPDHSLLMTIPARRAGGWRPRELHNRRCEGEAVQVCNEMAGAQGRSREAAAGQAAAGAQCYRARGRRAGAEAHGRSFGAASLLSSSALLMTHDNDWHVLILFGIAYQRESTHSVENKLDEWMNLKRM